MLPTRTSLKLPTQGSKDQSSRTKSISPRLPGSPRIQGPPSLVRDYLPLLVGITASMMIYAQFAIGQVVKIDGVAPFGGIQAETLDYVNLVSAAKKLMAGGAVGCSMAAFLVLGSGLWPYVKLYGLFYHVRRVADGEVNRTEARQRLEFLELLGKWSYTDVFLICFSQIIFFIVTEKRMVGPAGVMGSLQIELWNELCLPAVFLVTGNRITSALTHMAIYEMWPWSYYNCLSGPSDVDETKALLVRQSCYSSMSSMTSDDYDDDNDDVYKENRNYNRGALLFGIVSLLLLIASMWFPLLTVRRGGFLGLLLPEDQQDLSLSVISLATWLWESSFFQNGGSWPNRFFAATLINTACVGPLIELVLLIAASAFALANWEYSNNMARCVAGWFHSFACADMLVITCLIVVTMLPILVKLNMGNQCDSVEGLISNKVILVVAGLQDAASPECFSVSSKLELGWLLLALSCLTRVLVRFSWFMANTIPTMYGTAGHSVADFTRLGGFNRQTTPNLFRESSPRPLMERVRSYTLSDVRWSPQVSEY